MIQAFLAGIGIGVVRERTYQALERRMGFRDGVKHVALGFTTEAVFTYKAVRRLFVKEKADGSEAPARPKTTAPKNGNKPHLQEVD